MVPAEPNSSSKAIQHRISSPKARSGNPGHVNPQEYNAYMDVTPITPPQASDFGRRSSAR